jgi:alpha-beta hydrolase superfamily lysophospholipase
MITPFLLQNSRQLELLGDTHLPSALPKACVILMHGFKGYKDYGFIPVLAHDLCRAGLLVHRFNFSTSGMTNDIETFARPDLFEFDTWNRQVEDILCIVRAIRCGDLDGKDMPIFLIGHSRGGGSALLAAGRHGEEMNLAGVITINAVDRCCRMSQTEQDAMLDRGYSITQSARTKQDLRIDSAWLSEQIEHPESHDVLLQAQRIACPVCVLHGDSDQAVDPGAGSAIAQACNTKPNLLNSGNHVLNMSNPSSFDCERSQQLLEATGTITRFIAKHG